MLETVALTKSAKQPEATPTVLRLFCQIVSSLLTQFTSGSSYPTPHGPNVVTVSRQLIQDEVTS